MMDSALIGRSIDEFDTPMLVIDLDMMERNIQRCRDLVAGAGLAYRPHSKTHKSPIIARMQMAAGAVGICCAKLAEAEIMAGGGVGDILITTEVIGPAKIRRLMSLARAMKEGGGRISVVADCQPNIAQLSEAAKAAGLEIPVLVDVNVGMSRTGAPPGKEIAALAVQIENSPGLRFAGLQGYHGMIQMRQDFEERGAATREALAPLLESAELVRKEGLEVDVLTGGGTGTSIFDTAIGGLTELQPGSYLFMDSNYSAIDWTDAGAKPPYENSLSVIATVVSRPIPERATVDMGLKASSNDSGMALPRDLPPAVFQSGGDEHGILVFEGDDGGLQVGDRVVFTPSHCDTTINLYDRYVCHRGGIVEAVWPIAARGRTQ